MRRRLSLELLGEDDFERIVGVRVEDIEWPGSSGCLPAFHSDLTLA